MDSLKLDGSEPALCAFDNICAFLVISGKVVSQPAEFWAPFLGYAMLMENDVEEVIHVVEFFLKEVGVMPGIKQVKKETTLLLVTLFFGKYHSKIKNDKDRQQLCKDAREYFESNKKDVEVSVMQGNDFVKKNFSSFWQ